LFFLLYFLIFLFTAKVNILPALFYLLFSNIGWLSPALQLYLALPAPLELK